MIYVYEVQMWDTADKWVLDIPADSKLDAGVEVWEKICREGRNQDVESVFCVGERE